MPRALVVGFLCILIATTYAAVPRGGPVASRGATAPSPTSRGPATTPRGPTSGPAPGPNTTPATARGPATAPVSRGPGPGGFDLQKARADFQSPDGDTRARAVNDLCNSNNFFPNDFRKALADPAPHVRLVALCFVNGRITDPADWQLVQDLQKDSDPSVRLQAIVSLLRSQRRPTVDIDERTCLQLRDITGTQAFVNEWFIAHGIKEDATFDKLLFELTLLPGQTAAMLPASSYSDNSGRGMPPMPPGFGPPGRGMPGGLPPGMSMPPGMAESIRANLPTPGGWPYVREALPFLNRVMPPYAPYSPDELLTRQRDDLALLGQISVVSQKVLEQLAILATTESNNPVTQFLPQVRASVDEALPRVFNAMLRIDNDRTFAVLTNLLQASTANTRLNSGYGQLLAGIDPRNQNPGMTQLYFINLSSPDFSTANSAQAYFIRLSQQLTETSAGTLWTLVHDSNTASAEKLWAILLGNRRPAPPESISPFLEIALKDGNSAERLRVLNVIYESARNDGPSSPGLGYAFHDPDPKVREAVVNCVPRRTFNTNSPLSPDAQPILLGAFQDPAVAVSTAAFRVVFTPGSAWLQDPDVRAGLLAQLAPGSPNRSTAWEVIGSDQGANYDRFKGDPAFEHLLASAVWDPAPNVRDPAQRIWHRTRGELPDPPADAPTIVLLVFETLVIFTLLAGAAWGARRALRLPQRPHRITGALRFASFAGILTAVFLVVTTILVGVAVLLASSGHHFSFVNGTLAVLSIGLFAFAGIFILPWAIGTRSGRLLEAIFLMIFCSLCGILFAIATAVDLTQVLSAWMVAHRFDGIAMFRLIFDLLLLLSSFGTALSLILAWCRPASPPQPSYNF
ncbi:MAG TPA: hypothetical protein VHM90_02310 [Phycisphaerae bacterium]|nr:hypothetical protein [Phycisphaerae bacterium]